MSTALTSTKFRLPSRTDVGRFLRQWWWTIGAFVLVYGALLPPLVREWWTNEEYTHGLLTPFALAYLIYERRKILFSTPASPSALGFAVILASQVLLTVGLLGAEFFLQRISMLMFIAGLIVYLWGWQALSRTAFGLILLLLSIPLPRIIFNAVALPLQLMASAIAATVLQLLHVPVFREGNILILSTGLQLNVTEACSGIRLLVSLAALATLTTMLARFLPMRWWIRIAFILSTVPIALAANALRVAGTGLLAYNFGEAAAKGFLHSFSGALTFVLAFATLLIEMLLLRRFALSGKQSNA